LTTIEALRRRFPELALRLIIGADVLDDRDGWHRFDRIAELAPPIVLGRVGVTHPEAPPPVLPAVSSSHIRQLLATGRAEETVPLLPAMVRRYVAERGLYRGQEP